MHRCIWTVFLSTTDITWRNNKDAWYLLNNRNISLEAPTFWPISLVLYQQLVRDIAKLKYVLMKWYCCSFQAIEVETHKREATAPPIRSNWIRLVFSDIIGRNDWLLVPNGLMYDWTWCVYKIQNLRPVYTTTDAKSLTITNITYWPFVSPFSIQTQVMNICCFAVLRTFTLVTRRVIKDITSYFKDSWKCVYSLPQLPECYPIDGG
jgi:hypothetical protein